MKVLFYLIHPAHFHLFKNVIKKLKDDGHTPIILIKKKDILEDLLKEAGLSYHNILPEGRKNSKLAISIGLLKQDLRLMSFCFKNRPDMLIGTSVSIAHVGYFLRIPSYIVNEDDASVVPFFAKLGYPFATKIISPDVCNNGKWESKSLKYNSYHELAYLHPDHFKPNKEIVLKYIDLTKPFVIIRFSSLGAHHDFGKSGIDDELALKIIEIIEPSANVLITSERKFTNELEQYRMNINPIHIHHVMAFAKAYLGDSQTMAAEAGVLGIPFIRFNDFVGKIGYLQDLENNYSLGYGIRSDQRDLLVSTVSKLISNNNLKEEFEEKREIMLANKINMADYLYDFILNIRNESS